MKTISTTDCKRFDNSCYHHQYIANWIAVIMLRVLIGHTTINKIIHKIKGSLFLIWNFLKFWLGAPDLFDE